MVSSLRIFRASSRAKYMRKRRAGYKGSGRCTTNYHEGRLWRGGVGQCVQGQGVSHLFVRVLHCCLAGRHIRNLLPEVIVKLEPLMVETFVLWGRTRSGRCPTVCHGGSLRGGGVGQCARGPGASSRFGRILPGCLGGLNIRVFTAKIVIEVAFMTVEAFLLSRIVSGKYCRDRQVVAE